MNGILGFKVKGTKLAEMLFESAGLTDGYRQIAKEQTEGMSRDEVVEYVASLLFGIARIKQDIVNRHLFGSKCLHV